MKHLLSQRMYARIWHTSVFILQPKKHRDDERGSEKRTTE